MSKFPPQVPLESCEVESDCVPSKIRVGKVYALLIPAFSLDEISVDLKTGNVHNVEEQLWTYLKSCVESDVRVSMM